MRHLVKFCFICVIIAINFYCSYRVVAAPLRIAIVGDINGSYGSSDYPQLSLALRDKVLALKPDVVLSTGDVVAGQKYGLSTQNLQQMWHSFDAQFHQPLSHIGSVWLPSIGNHDGSKALSPLGQYLFAAERHQSASYWRSKLPSHPSLLWVDKQHYPFYYSLRWGDIVLLIIDASGSQLSHTEWQWLEQQLSSPALADAATRIVVGHLPLFAVAEGREAPGERLEKGEKLLKWFNQHQVDWYISGHQHAYYVGRVQKLNLLMAGGVPARALFGKEKSQSVFTLMTLNPSVSIQSWDLQTDTEVSLEQLPESLSAIPFTIHRWPASTLTTK